MIVEDKDNLIKMIEGNDILTLNHGGDHTSLKQHFKNKQTILIDNTQINNLEDVIVDKKIDDKDLQELIYLENKKREMLKIENIFSADDIKLEGFKHIFNDKFETTIINSNTNTNTEILPYNELNTNLKLVSNKLLSSISDINEAFEPIQINRKIKPEIISYDEILSKRDIENNNFKVAKNFKKNIQISL